ncbi:RER1A-like protein [Drosera capensis]
MDGIGGDGGAAEPPPFVRKLQQGFIVYRYYLDKTTPHAVPRWVGTLVLALIYALRVFYVQGFYIIAYALGIYILNLLIGFLSPLVDPESEGGAGDGPLLPTKGNDEFKPFIRRLPEFKFCSKCCGCIEMCLRDWLFALVKMRKRLDLRYSVTKAFAVAFVMTFFSAFDIPVFWPILLCYWFVLFVLTMKRQIAHMMKYKYIPFSLGKQRYGGKKASGGRGASRGD